MFLFVVCVVVFFFKQKTAYEMRISDWSSDVCSSDLLCRSQTRRADRGGVPASARAGIGTLCADRKEPGIHTCSLAAGAGAASGQAGVRNHEIGRASCRERVCQYV